MAKDRHNGTPLDRSGDTAARPIDLDTSHIKSSYCNMANVMGTREEIVLNFGVNQNWDRGGQADQDVTLDHRIIMSPFAAQRLATMLSKLIQEYENRYGSLD